MSGDQRLREELERAAERTDTDVTEVYASVRSRGGRARVRDRIALGTGAALVIVAVAVAVPRLIDRGTASPRQPAASPSYSAGPGVAGYYTLYLDSKRPAVNRYEIGGPWVVDVHPGGRITMQAPARGCCILDSTYEVHGHRIVVDGATQYDHCSGPGVYRWVVSTDGLRFSRIRDGCVVRALVFEERWRREGPPA